MWMTFLVIEKFLNPGLNPEKGLIKLETSVHKKTRVATKKSDWSEVNILREELNMLNSKA